MRRAAGRQPVVSFAILFACYFSAYALIPPLMRLVWLPEKPKPFVDDVLHQLPVAIAVGLVVAAIIMIGRLSRR